MGNTNAPNHSGKLVQLILRGRRSHALVQSDDDWQALGHIAARMLFWCGGAIHACRCEANELRFALEIHHAPVGAMVQHLSGGYAKRLRQLRGWHGNLFKHYTTLPLDDDFLDDLAMWLHRPLEPRARGKSPSRIWTADAAYLTPRSLPWITTGRVLRTLSIGTPGPAAYRRRKTQALSPQIIDLITRRHPKRKRRPGDASFATDRSPEPNGHRPTVASIARAVADYARVSFDDMRSPTRRRIVTKAKAIATVLCTRNGRTVAAAGRLFNRSRSTLIEQVEHYRATQPQIFAEAQTALAPLLDRTPERTRP